jgi:hypothetical protein
MKNENLNERELKVLEDEIRAFGIPFNSNEPDERYWATFRARVIERVEKEKTPRNIFAMIWSWISLSPVRNFSFGASLAAVVIAALLINGENQPLNTIKNFTPKTIESSSVSIPSESHDELANKGTVTEPQQIESIKRINKEKQNKITETSPSTGEVAFASETFLDNELEEPINLENFSEAELTSALKIVQNMK